MRHTLLFFSMLLAAAALSAQELSGEMLDAIHEKLAREMEDNFFGGDSLIIAEEEAWAEYFRTSDIDGEDAVGYHRGNRPPDGLRIGCICMDGTPSDERGRGACSGYGGVRFWRYQVSEDSVALFATERHYAHPQPLTGEELANLSSRNAFAAEPPAKRGGWRDYRLEDVLIAMMICVTIAYVAKMWFNRD